MVLARPAMRRWVYTLEEEQGETTLNTTAALREKHQEIQPFREEIERPKSNNESLKRLQLPLPAAFNGSH